jgi:hypothetical protein
MDRENITNILLSATTALTRRQVGNMWKKQHDVMIAVLLPIDQSLIFGTAIAFLCRMPKRPSVQSKNLTDDLSGMLEKLWAHYILLKCHIVPKFISRRDVTG